MHPVGLRLLMSLTSKSSQLISQVRESDFFSVPNSYVKSSDSFSQLTHMSTKWLFVKSTHKSSHMSGKWFFKCIRVKDQSPSVTPLSFSPTRSTHSGAGGSQEALFPQHYGTPTQNMHQLPVRKASNSLDSLAFSVLSVLFTKST